MECHDVVTTFVLQLSEKVETVQARMAMIACFHLWMLDAYRLRWAAEWDLPEVITESEHARRLAEKRAERFPLEDCSHLLADIDLEDDEMEADRVQWEQRIKQALRAKQLKGTKDGIRYGELMDWAGQEVSVYAQRGHTLAVLPDDQAEYVEQATMAREKLLVLSDEAPRDIVPVGDLNRMEKLRENGLRGIVRELGECEVTRLSVLEVADWVAEDFDGEDVVLPILRDRLDEIGEAIGRLVASLDEREAWKVTLPEGTDAEFVELLKRRIARAN
jgi:hypothetical protein